VSNKFHTRNKILFGILGCGQNAVQTHIPALLKNKKVHIVAVCDLNEKQAMKVAQKYKIAHYFGDIDDMLKLKDLDVVDICTPPQTHGNLAMRAIDAGHHVIVEKPMALSSEECDELIRKAKSKGVKICVIHNTLFTTALQRAKKLVDAGAIGKIVSVDIRYNNWKECDLLERDHWVHRLPGGIFTETLPHAIYLLLAFLPEIRRIQTLATRIHTHPWITYDELKILFDGGDSIGTISISNNSPIASITMDICGTNGTIHIDHLTQTIITHKARRPCTLATVQTSLESIFQNIAGLFFALIKFPWRYSYSGHYNLFKKFVDSIIMNEPVPVSGEEGKKVVQVLEEIWKQIEMH